MKLTRGPELLRFDLESMHVPSLRFINYYYISSFFSAAFRPSAPSPFHLPSQWYSLVPVRAAGEQSSRESMTLNSISFWQIFSPSRSYHQAFLWTRNNTLGWKALRRGHGLHMWWCLYYHGNAICSLWCRVCEQKVAWERRFNVQHTGHFESSDNIVAVQLEDWTNLPSWENQFDSTQAIHAEISLCLALSTACHFLDTCN